MTATKNVAFIGFDGVTALDLIGPSEAFGIAAAAGADNYRVMILGLTRKPFRGESGVLIQPEHTLDRAPPIDTLFIPGGSGLRRPEVNRAVSGWVKDHAPKIRRIASACTGIYGLAPTGLLDGRRVTTHWRFAQDVAQRFPRLQLDPNAIFLKDGRFYTSAGVTAGIDLALFLIEEDCGAPAALSVARELVVYLRRSGGQEQYSEPLRFQTLSGDRFGELPAWIAGHLDQDLSVEALAKKSHYSPRHFTRRFKEVFEVSPGIFVENMRLDEARRRLSAPNSTVSAVASSVGFTSPDSFRRAFQRRFGIPPSGYRHRFPAPKKSAPANDRRSKK